MLLWANHIKIHVRTDWVGRIDNGLPNLSLISRLYAFCKEDNDRMSMENSFSPQLRRHFLGTWAVLVECLDSLLVPLPMFVLFNAPWLQPSPPRKSYIQLCFGCFVFLLTSQLICAYTHLNPHTHTTLHVLTCFLTTVPPVSGQEWPGRNTCVLEQVIIMQFD